MFNKKILDDEPKVGHVTHNITSCEIACTLHLGGDRKFGLFISENVHYIMRLWGLGAPLLAYRYRC